MTRPLYKGAGLRAVLTGLLCFLLGIQFAAGAAAGRAACSRQAGRGFLASASIVLGVYFLLGLQGALMTAALAASLCAGSRLGLTSTATAAVSAAAVTLAASIGLFAGTGLMGLGSEDVRGVVSSLYSTRLPTEVMNDLVDLLAYLSPGAGAIQAVAGSAAAVAFFRATGGQGLKGREELRLGLEPSWIVIAGLLVAIWPGTLPGVAVRASHNALLFMTVPYFVVGAQVAGVLLRTGPSLALLAAVAVLLAPPAAFAAVVLTGVLDTWFDFRKRLRSRMERNPQ
jgi:hypothetical protein